MLEAAVKVLATSILVVTIAEVSRRSTLFGALLASLPLTSLLAIVWLYAETRDTGKVADLATSILWLVLPSLTFFVVLPLLLRRGVSFVPSLGFAVAMTAAGYFAMLAILRRLGIGP